MSKELISHSPDLEKLIHEGYEVNIVDDAYLFIHNVPYVTPQKKVERGILVSNIYQSGGKTIKPEWHAAFFIGECPSTAGGEKLNFVVNSNTTVINTQYSYNHTLSSKQDYEDHYKKTINYLKLLTHQANEIDPGATAATFKVYEPMEYYSVFQYADTNSPKAFINPITDKLKGQKVAIVGLGGTGSYILDQIAKTPVSQIHLFDGDYFFQNNAFRAPGAPPKAKFYERIKKTDYFNGMYSNMHKGIYSHPYNLDGDNIQELDNMTSVFLSLDPCPEKKNIIDRLIAKGILTIHCGLGLQDVDGSLRGQVKVTTINKDKHDHIASRINLNTQEEDLYDRNIQVADLNALNAIFAVIRWKKTLGFYKDHDREYFSNYVIYTNEIHNNDIPL
jgi:hypothetical protein